MFYYAKRMTSAVVGHNVIGVRCDRCGCEYCYELARVGVGRATAHYGIGTQCAGHHAVEQSQRDLVNRMTNEAELVPCPQCDWIGEDLIAGYRLSRYRRLSKIAACIGFFGSIASLLCAWFISQGPAADRNALPLFLIWGPLICVGSAIGIIGLRSWLRRRIQPNKNFPLPPRVPNGTPPAMVLNLESGQLEIAKPQHLEVDGSEDDWTVFHLGKHELPQLCCECLSPPELNACMTVPVLNAIQLTIPLCKTCSSRLKSRCWRLGLGTWVATTTVGVVVLMALRLGNDEFWILLGALGLVAVFIGAAVGSRFTTPFRFRVVDKSRGLLRVWFRNPVYSRKLGT